eukprot:Trichotokara_eunicae@DN2309_c0_g1_i1.p2
MSVDSEGNSTLHLKKNFKHNLRGLKYSNPRPTWGREGNVNNTVMNEDEFLLGGKNFRIRSAQNKKREMLESLETFETEISEKGWYNNRRKNRNGVIENAKSMNITVGGGRRMQRPSRR